MSLFSLENLYRQYLACRRGKRNTANALRFEARQEQALLDLRDALASRSYQPGRSVCFFVKRPKLREVFAADFTDRVVHHVLVSHLEKTWERVFIHDSHACRRGHGIHGAVARLQQFMRQASANGTRAAWALQLDVKNYFMSIDKQRLYQMVADKLDTRRPEDAEALWLADVLIFHDCTVSPVIKGDPGLITRLPSHKTLFHVPPGKGLPIGNLNSQFFANVYLNALDQFVKHRLGCRWYLRYCDDFVLLANTPTTLQHWCEEIAQFLDSALLLQLNGHRQRLVPVSDGLDFLGYIVRPQHLLVRRRVIGHLHELLGKARKHLVHEHATHTQYLYVDDWLDRLQAGLASYLGHILHAASFRLLADLWQRHAWLASFFDWDAANRSLRRRDVMPPHLRSVLSQYRHWVTAFPDHQVWIQVGAFLERLQWPPRRLASRGRASVSGARARVATADLKVMRPNRRGAVCGFPMGQLARRLAGGLGDGLPVLVVGQGARRIAGGGCERRPAMGWVRTPPALSSHAGQAGPAH